MTPTVGARVNAGASRSRRQTTPTVRDDDPRPEPPVRPSADDCCRSGCDPCVFDLYNEALERYHAALAAWEKRHGPRAR
ncbi:oxidoreductase-like domain-containing protein [Paraburkholderia edwinii]|uniref:oxidoreductase-like domain-containing protein n=1 Tax=Paraburkholderia edwinii TaxID=2861782 RepID=UPI0031BB92FE